MTFRISVCNGFDAMAVKHFIMSHKHYIIVTPQDCLTLADNLFIQPKKVQCSITNKKCPNTFEALLISWHYWFCHISWEHLQVASGPENKSTVQYPFSEALVRVVASTPANNTGIGSLGLNAVDLTTQNVMEFPECKGIVSHMSAGAMSLKV